ncbi:hypothetical protein ACHAWF_002642 [Thalassiosira exigua]
MAKTAVGTDLLHSLDVITELRVEVLRENLRVLPRLEVLLPVQEPKGDFELARVLDDGDEFLDLVRGQLPGALVHGDFGLLADKVCEPAPEALDFGEAEDDVPLALNVGVEDTQDVLELVPLHHRHTPAMTKEQIGHQNGMDFFPRANPKGNGGADPPSPSQHSSRLFEADQLRQGPTTAPPGARLPLFKQRPAVPPPPRLPSAEAALTWWKSCCYY